jgi:hypothetical protein
MNDVRFAQKVRRDPVFCDKRQKSGVGGDSVYPFGTGVLSNLTFLAGRTRHRPVALPFAMPRRPEPKTTLYVQAAKRRKGHKKTQPVAGGSRVKGLIERRHWIMTGSVAITASASVW